MENHAGDTQTVVLTPTRAWAGRRADSGGRGSSLPADVDADGASCSRPRLGRTWTQVRAARRGDGVTAAELCPRVHVAQRVNVPSRVF